MPRAWQVGLQSDHPAAGRLTSNSFPDLCSNLEVDEVEIFSLIEEQIPKYKIRADNITSFAGTVNQDFEFVQFPALNIPDNIGLGLTSDQIRETLNYFREYLWSSLLRSYEWKRNHEWDDVGSRDILGRWLIHWWSRALGTRLKPAPARRRKLILAFPVVGAEERQLIVFRLCKSLRVHIWANSG